MSGDFYLHNLYDSSDEGTLGIEDLQMSCAEPHEWCASHHYCSGRFSGTLSLFLQVLFPVLYRSLRRYEFQLQWFQRLDGTSGPPSSVLILDGP